MTAQRQTTGGTFAIVREIDYSYYNGTEAHGSAGDFAIPMGIAPASGQTECRLNGPTRVEITFDAAITAADGTINAGSEVTVNSPASIRRRAVRYPGPEESAG